ncbi:unnamed protein product, partial [Urochloa humidicola]
SLSLVKPVGQFVSPPALLAHAADGRDTTASLLLAVLTHYLPVHGYCSSSLIPSPHSQPLLPLILPPLSRDSMSRAPPADSPGSSHLPRIRCIHGISTFLAPS